MVNADLINYDLLLTKNKKDFKNIKKIFLLSPCLEQQLIFKKHFPTTDIYSLSEKDWDLNFKFKEVSDLIFAGNVFHYSKNPALWFENVFASCRLFLIQDLINRKRGQNLAHLGHDNDSMRYSYKENKSDFENAYNLDIYEEKIIFFDTYVDSLAEKSTPLHFISLLKGNL